MDIYSAYAVLGKSVLEVLDSTNRLNTVEEPKVERIVRLKENPFVLTEETERVCASVITAHNLSDYRNSFHSIKLKHQTDSWLLALLDMTKGEDGYGFVKSF